MMKKAYSFLLVFLFAFSLSAMIQSKVPAVLASTQQGQTPVSITLTSYFAADNIVTHTISDSTYGNSLKFDANIGSPSGFSFVHWVVNGIVRKDLAANHQFTLTKTNNFQAVFVPDNHYAVTFMDSNGKILKVQYVNNTGSDDATAPDSLPTKPGHTFSGWSNTFENVTENKIVTMQYVVNENPSTFTVSVENGTGGGIFTYNTLATVTANSPQEGMYFHHWELDDQIVSYQNSFTFTVLENSNLRAIYSTSEMTPVPLITISNILSLRANNTSFQGRFELPAGNTLVEIGLVGHASPSAILDLGSVGVIRYPINNYYGATKEFLISIPTANVGGYRAYMIYKNASNNLVTVYNENAWQITNRGFETGNLYGWNSYRIWKDESGIDAFVADRVSSGTYFSSHPYNRDGTYNFGITGGSVTWGQAEERMGHMRSSNFVLAGSGWISFKLGGGRTSSFAYVSIRQAEDNVEVARFGNPHFNNTTKANAQYSGPGSISNAEAFLFQYYADLSSHIGKKLYISLTDASSYNWSILSADSFETYLPSAPTTNSDTLAQNIAPAILGVGSGSNTILNGNFDNGLTNWQNVNGTFRIDDGRARSDQGGDAALGVLRSSAFKVLSTTIIQLHFSGGLTYDKQIFISIKEVGTNIEVQRWVRRSSDSGYAGSENRTHLLNVSNLSLEKEYYIEICDNTTSGWGLAFIDNFAFVNLSEWTSQSARQATAITPLQTLFIYNRP
jgi:hypothetical protein